MSKKFLIGQLACYGDCLYATTIAKQIKHDFPDSHLTWAVASKYKSILLNNPHIDELWELPIEGADLYSTGWASFQAEAIRRKNAGVFDEIIFSQVAPLNWHLYTKTIRHAILSTYRKIYSVSLDPVLRLTETEIEKVKEYAARNNLNGYSNVILFEYAPGSGQSKVNINFATEVAKEIVGSDPGTCFIFSSPVKLDQIHPQIIDASELSFRENAELTKYCTLLVGCSSGITWISTSDWAKPLPMLQLLDRESAFFAGVVYDLKVHHLDSSRVVEMVEFDKEKVVKCINALIHQPINIVKKQYQQEYKPGRAQLENVITRLMGAGASLEMLLTYYKKFFRENRLKKSSIGYPKNKIYRTYWNSSLNTQLAEKTPKIYTLKYWMDKVYFKSKHKIKTFVINAFHV